MASGLNLLPIFVAIIEEKHLGRVATRMGASQPSISRALSVLREDFGDQIVFRTGEGVEPTPFALAMYPKIKESLNTLSVLYGEKKHFDPSKSEKPFHISCMPTSDVRIINGLASFMKVEGGGTSLSVSQLYPNDFMSDLRTGKLDGVIDTYKSIYNGLNKKLIKVEKLLLVCSRSHPRIKGNHITLSEFKQEKHVVFSQTPVASSFFTADDLKELSGRKVAFGVSNFLDLMSVVSATDFVGLASEKDIAQFEDLFEIRGVELPFSKTDFEISMFWHESRRNDLSHKWLRDAMTGVSSTLTS